MKSLRSVVQICLLFLCLLLVSVGLASAATLTLSGNILFSSLDGSAQDSDGLANGVFTVNGDLDLAGTINCNDDPPLPGNASACPIQIAVTGDLTMEAGSGIFAENRSGGGHGGSIYLHVDGNLALQGPGSGLPGAVVSSSRLSNGSSWRAGDITILVGGGVGFQEGTAIAASTPGGTAGMIAITAEGAIQAAGLIVSGPSRTVLSSRWTGLILGGGASGQSGGRISLRSHTTAEPAIRIDSGAIVASQGEENGGQRVLLEACGIEVRGLVASVSKQGGPSLVAVRSGKGILVDGRDLGTVGSRLGRIRADGSLGGAAGYLVDLFAQSNIQVLGPDPSSMGAFAVSSSPGTQAQRPAGGTVTAISLAGSLTAVGKAFEAGRSQDGNKGGTIDLKAQNNVDLDGASLAAVGDFTSTSKNRAGGKIFARSYQGAVSWTFGTGDVRPTDTGSPANRGTITLTACTTIDTTGSQFPATGSTGPLVPVENEGVCSPAAPQLPAGEQSLPVCNEPPVANAQSVETDEDTAVTITLTGSDPNSDPLTFSIVTQPVHGSLGALTMPTPTSVKVVYTPSLNYNGSDSFTFKVDDGHGGTDTATVTITIHAKNDPPSADDDTYNINEGGTLNVPAPGVLDGDTDPDGDSLTAMLDSGPAYASSFTLNADGSFTYVHDGSETTSDSFTYHAKDGSANSNVAMVTIAIAAVNDPPAANPDTADITEEAPNVPAANTVAGNVLTNDTDSDSSLTVSAVAGGSVGSPRAGSYGSVTINSNGSFTYTLNDDNPAVNALAPGGTLTDTFGYTASDGALTSSSTLTVTIHGADDPPTPDDDAAEFIGNTELRVDLEAGSTPAVLATTPTTSGVLDGDMDPEGGTITISGIVGCDDVSAPFDCVLPGQGMVSLRSDGRFTFVPEAGDTDPTASFQYTLTGNPVPATVTLTRKERVWYVKNDDGGGTGVSNDPFATLAEAQTASVAGDTLYVFEGDGDTTGQDQGIILKASQRLIGEGVALDVPVSVNGGPNPTVLRDPGNRPTVDNTNAGGHAISATDAIPARIVGLSLIGSSNAIDITTNGAFSGSGSLTIANNTVDNTVRPGGAEGIDVNTGGTGTVTLSIHDNTLTATGNAIDIARTAGTVLITAFDDNTVSGNTAGSGIVISGPVTFDSDTGTAGNQAVNGGNTAIGVLGNPVTGSGLVLNNVTGALDFTDLDIYAGGAGLVVQGTGAFTSATGTRITVTPASPDGAGTGTIDADNGAAVDITSATIDLRLDRLDSVTSGSGVNLNTVGGEFRAPSGSAISKTSGAGTAFSVASSSATVNYGGTLNVTSGSGVSLTGNSGAVNFSGQLTLNTGSNPGFAATGGGTVTATATNSTITTSTATALSVNGPDIGLGGLVFQSISANGAGTGILLQDTGTTAGLTVSGTGTTAGSGGTIQNISGRGASFINAAKVNLKNMNFTNTATSAGAPCGSAATVGGSTGCNAAIHLNNVATVTLDRLNITTSGQQGINGIDVTGMTLSNSTLSGLGNAADEDGLHFLNLLGTSSISATSIASSGDDNVNIQNRSATPSTINITNSSFNTGVLGSGLLFGIRDTANTTINISTVTSDNNFSGGIVADAFDTATMKLVVTGSTITNNNDGVQVSSSQTSNAQFDINDNDFIGNDFLAVTLLKAAFSTGGTLEGAVRNNNPITVGNGRTTDAISVFQAGGGALKVAITNNTFNYAGTQRVILLQGGQDGNGSLDATVTGNNVDIQLDGTGNAVAGILAQAAITGPGNTTSLCADLGGAGALKNTFTHSLGGSMAGGDIRVRQRNDGTFRLPGYGGSATDTAAVITYLSGRNTLVSAPTATFDSTGFGGGAACSQPTIP